MAPPLYVTVYEEEAIGLVPSVTLTVGVCSALLYVFVKSVMLMVTEAGVIANDLLMVPE